ncbi:SNF-related serine-threonine protein kinase, putative [Bodo saltans]|uniref:SNF-related serine-threonine protein kinase, putative n=1 Tax=Bodo saltans TaxID=75058 RepID=A0A0S4IJL8_BODSA|nr:SNF-related serine-threonine protein kinase, putative [Bodo saltans]|eukprot:CUE89401.1 SNF-related serine-threonine protein kinase, putative [Bodo saltans]
MRARYFAVRDAKRMAPEYSDLKSRYEIPAADLFSDEFICTGGGGHVFGGRWNKKACACGRRITVPIAVKCYIGTDAESQCLRELDTLVSVDHPNIVKAYGYACGMENAPFSGSAVRYLILELAPGRSLHDKKAELKDLRKEDAAEHVERVAGYAVQILDGLRCLHEQHLLHLDLKPANGLCFDRGVIKLCDFGASKHFRASLGDASAAGGYTLQYAAPETMLRDDMDAAGNEIPHELSQSSFVSPATDMYSFGALLCELLTGVPVWGRKHEVAICCAVGSGESPDVSRHPWPEGTEEIHQLVCRLLSFNPDERDTLEDAQRILSGFYFHRVTTTLMSPCMNTSSDGSPSGLSPAASMPGTTMAALRYEVEVCNCQQVSVVPKDDAQGTTYGGGGGI